VAFNTEKLLKSEKTTLTLEVIGEGKIRVNSSSWDDAKVILADQVLEVRAMGKRMLVLRRPKFPPDSDAGFFRSRVPGVMRHGRCDASPEPRVTSSPDAPAPRQQAQRADVLSSSTHGRRGRGDDPGGGVKDFTPPEVQGGIEAIVAEWLNARTIAH
jgi:hypothetical protein